MTPIRMLCIGTLQEPHLRWQRRRSVFQKERLQFSEDRAFINCFSRATIYFTCRELMICKFRAGVPSSQVIRDAAPKVSSPRMACKGETRSARRRLRRRCRNLVSSSRLRSFAFEALTSSRRAAITCLEEWERKRMSAADRLGTRPHANEACVPRAVVCQTRAQAPSTCSPAQPRQAIHRDYVHRDRRQ